MKKQMCAQFEILEKIRKKGKVNGYDVDLAEAQAKDYMSMKARLDNIENDVSTIKTDMAVVKSNIDLVLKAVRSTQEDADRYRLIVDVWRALFGTTKKTIMTFIMFGLVIGFVNIKDVIELLRSII